MGRLFSSSTNGSTHSVDWRGPAVMFLCFISAIAFAIGHHVLNLCLEGEVVTDFPIEQQWVSRGGNALAYLVKVLLVLATGTAYFQCVWHNARGRPTKISHFDSMFGVLDNVLELRHVQFWFRRPLLMLAVVIVWLIPLIAIITPGTLSVIPASIAAPQTISVQQREYGTGLYGASVQADNGTVFYGGARSYLKGPTLGTLVETEILSMGTVTTNLTYSMDFYGPAVSCSKAGSQVTQQLTDVITRYQDQNKTSLMYDVWIPKPDAASNMIFVDGSIVVTNDTNQDLRMLDQTSPDAATVYYSLAPEISAQAKMANPIYVIECALYNASWHVDFDVRSTGEQQLTPTLVFENWMPGWSSIRPALRAGNETARILDYAGLMETFGSITSGKLEVPDDASLPFTQTSLALETSPILFAEAAPDTFSEAAMVQLAQTLESLFENMTLSARYAVLPQQNLRGDTPLLSVTAVNATSTFYRNVYTYDARDLVVAYSLAIVSSAACILLAMLAVRDMGAVYTNSFSTTVRVTRAQSRLDTVIVDDRDRSGALPLPRRIADAYVWVAKEPKLGLGIGRGRVHTAPSDSTSNHSKGAQRWWWGKEQEMDLEKKTVKNVKGLGPIVVVSEARFGTKAGREGGGWI